MGYLSLPSFCLIVAITIIHMITQKRCPFCNLNNHPSSKSLKVSNSVSQKNILRKNGRCFVWYTGAHLAS